MTKTEAAQRQPAHVSCTETRLPPTSPTHHFSSAWGFACATLSLAGLHVRLHNRQMMNGRELQLLDTDILCPATNYPCTCVTTVSPNSRRGGCTCPHQRGIPFSPSSLVTVNHEGVNCLTTSRFEGKARRKPSLCCLTCGTLPGSATEASVPSNEELMKQCLPVLCNVLKRHVLWPSDDADGRHQTMQDSSTGLSPEKMIPFLGIPSSKARWLSIR